MRAISALLVTATLLLVGLFILMPGPVEAQPVNSVDVQVSSSTDDTCRDGTTWGNFQTFCWAGQPFSWIIEGSFRFASVNIPVGVTITEAYFEPWAISRDPSGGPPLQGGDGPGTKTNIYAEASDNPTAPTSHADFLGRPFTTAFTAWDDDDLPSGFVKSPDISAVVQEIIDRPDHVEEGWIPGDSIQLFWKDDGSSFRGYRFQTSNLNASRGAKLHVEWGVNSAINNLRDDVDQLETDGDLTTPQANQLRNRLDSAQDEYNAGDNDKAIFQLNKFSDKVAQYVNQRILTQEQGDNLTDQSAAIIAQIQSE